MSYRTPMQELNRLARDMKKLPKDLRKMVSDAAANKGVEMVDVLARHSKVDTSKALSNWRLTVGFPATTEIEAHLQGSGGSSRSISIQETILTAKNKVKNKKLGQTIFLTNNIDYMNVIEGASFYGQQEWIESLTGLTARNWDLKWPVFR